MSNKCPVHVRTEVGKHVDYEVFHRDVSVETGRAKVVDAKRGGRLFYNTKTLSMAMTGMVEIVFKPDSGSRPSRLPCDCELPVPRNCVKRQFVLLPVESMLANLPDGTVDGDTLILFSRPTPRSRREIRK